MKRAGIILAFAALVLLFASIIEAKENTIEEKSNHTANATMLEKAILAPPFLGFILNNSSLTQCTEEDNIDIPLYYPNLTAYRIIATHPDYLPTNVTDKGKNCTNCRCIDFTTEAKKIYDDKNVIIETVKENPWWRNSKGMDVSAIGGMSISNVIYFRIYKLIPETQWEYTQVFVLYEDGNSRMTSQPPQGMKNVTFGPSVILGAAETGHFVGINSVEIDPINLSMDIIYEDKTTAHVELRVDRNQNIVDVSNITYDTSNRPFARFRSMWVTDGNADTDHIQTQDGVFPIMGGWAKLKGAWWQFFRKVPSIHNTYCPDIKIEVVS